ncbi:MAG: glycosyltransferase, partial [Chloroflexota bacterium]
FDLLQAYFITKAGFVGVYAARTLGIPCVVSARGNDLERAVFDPARAAHTLYALQAADALTANAHSLAQRAQALAPGRAVTLIPNGVDGRRFRPQAAGPALRVELGLPADGPVIGFSGEARAKKGLAVLLVAFRLLAERRAAAGAPPPGLLLLGGVRPGDDEALVRVFRKQHPALCVVQTEPLPQAGLADYYALMDVLALPSLHDGLPNALLEGMACGRAVAACPAGGIADVLVDGQNGLLSPPGDAGALAENLQRLLDDADLRARLGAEARRCVLAQYTPEAELHATLQVYRGCLAAHRLKEAR